MTEWVLVVVVFALVAVLVFWLGEYVIPRYVRGRRRLRGR